MMAVNMVTATDQTFEHLIQNSTKPVIVDFWAEWCVPCRTVAPILEEIAESRSQEVTVVKVNVDEYPNLAADYGIMSIPTVIRFQSGQESSRIVGAASKAQILKKLGL